ncbi:MAG: hypothetical protein IJG38_05440 [Thermoguttaceae bacterium]|nr:hypothetical protein [Thermoguttaceae bacterium]MBQ6616019.1 hypothetical protein [Thermoguttaceae bacterium]
MINSIDKSMSEIRGAKNKILCSIFVCIIISSNAVFGQGGVPLPMAPSGVQTGQPIPPAQSNVSEPFAIPLPTMGGMQYWSDEVWFQGWRIQYNSIFGQYRLIDSSAKQYAFGSFKHCKERLEKIKQARRLPPMRGRAVILVHGFLGNYKLLDKLGNRLRQSGRYDQVIQAAYPSTQGSLEAHAAWMERLISSLDGITTIDFVAHSMGGLVIRSYMSGRGNKLGIRPDPRRFGRVVFIGTPNYGTYTAQYHYQTNPLAKDFAGASLYEMGEGWKEFSKGLIVPPCPYGVIAGGTPDGKGHCGGLRGDDDGVVELSSTRLSGSSDYKVLFYKHNALLNQPETAEMVNRFLEFGYFLTPEQMTPLR